MSNLLVFGDCWLGHKIADYFGCPIVESGPKLFEDIQKAIDTHKPKVIINALEIFERSCSDADKEVNHTIFINSSFPLLLAEAAIKNGLKFVQISSGYLFDSEKPGQVFTEDDSPNFFDLFYSRSKMYAEAALYALRQSVNILQVRINLPMDHVPSKGNLLSKLISYDGIIEGSFSITYIPDFLEALKFLIKKDCEGIYNIVNYSTISFREILEEYRTYKNTHKYATSSLKELKLVRPNVVLSTDKLEEAGYPIRDIHDAMKECIEKYVHGSPVKTDERQTEQDETQKPRTVLHRTPEDQSTEVPKDTSITTS